MARGVQYQGSFIGGQWSPEAHGRLDHPWHASAMALSVNGFPVEGGQWVRRSGTRWLAPTFNRTENAAVRAALFDTAHRHVGVIASNGTDGFLNLFRGIAVVVDSTNTITASSSTSGTLSVTTNTATGWAVGDYVILTALPTAGLGYLNRWLAIETISGTSITLANDAGGPISFDSTSNALVGATINRVLRFRMNGLNGNVLPAQFVNIGNLNGATLQTILIHPQITPYTLTLTTENTGSTPDAFTFAATVFKDGPYLDLQGGNDTPETGTVSAYTGSITFTPATTTFTSSDVGRMIRLFHQPAAWASGTTYNVGDYVTYNSAWYRCVYGGLSNVQPGSLATVSSVQYTVWAPAPTAGVWAWGTITAQASTSCTVSLQTNLNSANGSTISQWRLGKFMAGQYPGCGILHEGRLWLAGAVEGQLDSSNSDDPFVFSPTDANGNVFDQHSLSLKLAAASADQIQWFRVDRSGLLFGTTANEYMMNGGGVDTPITPANFNIRNVSNYGSSAVKAITAAFSHVFVNLYNTQVYEFVTDVFASSPSGRRLNQFQQNLFETVGNIVDMAYIECKVPTIWMPGAENGTMLSCTYRRFSRFMSSPPDIAGWSQHSVADGACAVVSVATLDASRDGEDAESLYMTTANNADNTVNGVQLLKVDGEGL